MARARFDELDVRILDQLQKDGRMPFTSVAKELGVSEATVRARVGRMTRERLVKFVTDVDPTEFGLVYVYLGLQIQGPALKRAVAALNGFPEITYTVICTGTFDLLAELICQTGDDLLRLLQDVRAIPGITRVETMTVLSIEKDEWRYWAMMPPRE